MGQKNSEDAVAVAAAPSLMIVVILATRCVGGRYVEVDDGAGCVQERRPVFERHWYVYVLTYYWFRVIFIMCLPCVVLIVVNTLLIGAMRTASARRQQLVRTQRAVAMAAENDRTTLMLVVVVAVMLVVEFPMVVIFLLVLGTLVGLSIPFVAARCYAVGLCISAAYFVAPSLSVRPSVCHIRVFCRNE